MNVDGSDRIRLTDDPESNLAPLWSPDSQRIAYTLYDPDKKTSDLFVMDSNGENRRRLTDRTVSQDMLGVWAEEWSLDGKYIFYLDQSQISKVNTESGDITKVTPEADWPSYLLVKEDSKIRFLSPCGKDSGEFCSKVKVIGEDGTAEETLGVMKLQQVCSSGDPGSFYYMAKWSPDLAKIIFVFSCSRSGGLVYIANADGSDFKSLTSNPVPTGSTGFNKDIFFDWSPDGQSIIFTSSPDDSQKQDLSILSVRDALQNPELRPTRLNLSISQASNLAWQPALSNKPVEITLPPKPVQTSSGAGLVAFMSEQTGNQDIYTMRADGSQLTDITNNPANDYGPLWSPDGQRIAFISERTGNEDIFVMDADGSNPAQLTDNAGYDGYFSWSPDGKRIIYEAGKQDINQDGQLAVMDSDGSNKAVLTEPGSYFFLGWSPDSKKIVYLKQNIETVPQDSVVVMTNIDGTGQHEWNFSLDKIKWEDNLHFVGYGFNNDSENPRWVLRRFSANGDPPVEIASHGSPIIQLFKDTHVVEGGTILAYYGANGDPTPYKSWRFFDVCGHGGDQFIPMASYLAAPDGNRALIVIPCNSGTTRFYIDPMDGSEIRKLTDFTLGQSGQIIDLTWSPDEKVAIVAIPDGNEGRADIYRFDIDKMLSDPSVQPVRLTTDEAMKYDTTWQPVP
jgi:TolB protein